MYRLQAKLLALAIVASGAELGTNDRGLSNASDEVGRQLLRLVVGVRYKILSCVVMVYLRFCGVFSSATSSASDS